MFNELVQRSSIEYYTKTEQQLSLSSITESQLYIATGQISH